MKYQTLDDIYTGNHKIRGRLKERLAALSDEQITRRHDGEKWSIAEIVEHISIVDENTAKICAKLLKKAQEAGRTADGSVSISENFIGRTREIAGIKVEAPSFVVPSGEKSIHESIARLDETEAMLTEMRGLFESASGSEFTFPHPFFGEINAHEWLALKGGHELRHLKQIERILESQR